METITGTNPTTKDTPEALAARLKAAELNPEIAKAHVTVGKAASDVQPPSTGNPPAVTPPAGNNPPPAQTQDKGGVPIEEILKRNEHLEKGIREKEDILKKNKELLAKFHQTSQAAAQSTREVGAQVPIPEGGNGQELEDQKFLARLAQAENDPLEISRLIDERAERIADRKFSTIKAELDQSRQDRIWSGYGEELVELAKAGHSWIVTEGLDRFAKVFQDRPWLLQSRTPYSDALRFIDAGTASVPAQNGTPILGGGNAIPPPSSVPAATTEQKMSELSKQFQEAARWNDKQKMTQLIAEMGALERGR